MYFKNFPNITYNGIITTDITIRVRIKEKVKQAVGSWDYYTVRDGETPEQLAYKGYGNSNYHWILMLLNDMVDPIYDWILTQGELDDYITKSYGETADNPHHYMLAGRIVDASTPSAIVITNREFEDSRNEEKREILVLKPQYLESVLNEFNRLIKDA